MGQTYGALFVGLFVLGISLVAGDARGIVLGSSIGLVAVILLLIERRFDL